MKKTLLLLFTFLSCIMQAQVVNIPDANFKAKMTALSVENSGAIGINDNVIIVDVNGDGEIQTSEAAAVYKVHVGSSNISSLEGVQYFPNVREIVAGYNNIVSFDATGMNNLWLLAISFNPMTSINVSGLPNLEKLFINYNALTNLNLSQLPALRELHCGDNNITSLTISGLPSLVELKLNDDDSGVPNIPLQELSLYDLPLIDELWVNNCNLSSLDLSNIPSLRILFAEENPFTELDLSGLPNLIMVNLSRTALTQVDLSANPLLQQCNVYYNDDLEYLNLKNGSMCNLYTLAYNPNLTYICIDEGEDVPIAEDMEFYGLDGIQLNTYCTFTPGDTYNVITGSFLFDDEGDGCDSDDVVINNIKVNINSQNTHGVYFSNTGLYSFYTQAGTFTITPDFENDLFTITPPFAEVNFTSVDSLVTTQNFCLTPNGNHPDLDIVIVPTTPARPGFDANYKIVYRNKGNQTLSGNIVFTYQEDVLDFISANPSEDGSSSGTLIWNYTDLAPFQQREIYVILNVNGPMETPPVNINDQLGFTATINPVSGDDTPDDNVFELKQVAVGSMDPNDITCLEGNSVNPDKIGEYLHYNINFENTGTAPATFIVVKDVIDTTQFDMSTLQLINASHPVQAKVTDNKVEFRFDAINLGPEEKGNVVFKIKTLNTLYANDDVTQKADIFFDYNWPIATNNATTVFEVLSRGDFAMDNSVKVYPNPAKGVVNINASSLIKSIELYDVQGRLLQAGSNASMDISGRAMGIYFVKVFTENGMKVEKVIKN